jgi:hydrogenase maturation protein HypF
MVPLADRKSKRINDSQCFALAILCRGTVQGVGFRPFIYNLAKELDLSGWVLNSTRGLEVHVEGPSDKLEVFVRRIKEEPPRLARISSMEVEKADWCGYMDFCIRRSTGEEETDVLVPPDTAVCSDCIKEVFDYTDRHYLYPFTNCTNCGPRFTIVRDFPYDRSKTTMSLFPMCDECREEYNNPADRRFHAQPVACPRCGPRVILTDNTGQEIAGDWRDHFFHFIKEGKIVGIKGLGGFHLSCDAHHQETVALLRERKGRPAKPLAVMARDLDTVKKYCRVSEQEEKLLSGVEAPIVVLDRLDFCALPPNLAPGLKTLGVMLPYTPLHLLLFNEEVDLLVMTSGNPSGLPLEKDNREAVERLGGIADYFIMHNRDIENRTDDSVLRVAGGTVRFNRRSRGYVPRPVEIPMDPDFPAVVLGAGGEMKNSFCLVKQDGSAYPSQYMGEIDTLEAMENYRDSLDKFERFLEVKPEIVGYDMHPGYNSSKLAKEIPETEKFAVQHHHGHMAAVMAENMLNEPVIGVILDGTGYGLDGNIWGCEFLAGDYLDFTRHAHLSYIPLIGGERAVKNPWLVSLAYLIKYFGEKEGLSLAHKFLGNNGEISSAARILSSGINCPLASSTGRLFDAVSALLGVCRKTTYEGQPAIQLGELATGVTGEDYGSMLVSASKKPLVLSPQCIFRGLLRDMDKGEPIEKMSTKFHNSLINTIADTVQVISGETGLKKVVFSGGTFHNEYLAAESQGRLEERGFEVYTHKQLPTNDGGICLGQAAVAYWRWHKDVSVNTL